MRLLGCAVELLALLEPTVHALSPAQKRKVLQKMNATLEQTVVAHCRYDADHYASVHRTRSPAQRSTGQDAQADQWARCLGKNACVDFAQCVLELARLKKPQKDLPKG